MTVTIADGRRQDDLRWSVNWKLEKFNQDFSDRRIAEMYGFEPIEVIEGEGNLLMFGGASNIWQSLIGNGTATPAQTLTYFDNTNAKMGFGDSNTAEVATHTDLQASTNKVRVAMDATYPAHTPATTSGGAIITFRATADGSTANFVWNEWALFNASSGGRMLNRKVASLGTKTTGSWTLTVTLTLS